jgi:L-lactate dehydrogenase complex protein LldE
VLGVEEVGAHFDGVLTYHASCHLHRELGIDRQPRTLLSHVAGAEVVEMTAADECCGFGGLFAIKNGEISTAMGQRKTQNIVKSDADVVTLCDVSCMTHINGLLSRQGQRVRAVHIAQVLANQVDVTPRAESASEAKPDSPRRAAGRMGKRDASLVICHSSVGRIRSDA